MGTPYRLLVIVVAVLGGILELPNDRKSCNGHIRHDPIGLCCRIICDSDVMLSFGTIPPDRKCIWRVCCYQYDSRAVVVRVPVVTFVALLPLYPQTPLWRRVYLEATLVSTVGLAAEQLR